LAAAATLLVVLGLRGSSAFDVETVRVRGVTGPTARVVAEETRRLVGARSLLALDPGALEQRLAALPFVRSARVDRAFPHTVAVRVALEQPAAVVVSGTEALTVSRSGRVMGRTDARRRRSDLPLLAATTIAERPGARIADPAVLAELEVANAVPPGFGLRLATVQIRPDGLVAETRRGIRIELGDTSALEAKLLAARAVAAAAAADEPRLIDVTVPALPAVSGAAPDDATLAGELTAAAADAVSPQAIDVAAAVGDLFAPTSTSR
jgi:cell division protein FtsQ